jgi:anti-sigma factor RsiW
MNRDDQRPISNGRLPTDEELMLFADGELDEGRAAEVAAIVASHPRARAVVAALRQASDVLASDALEHASVADSIVDGVMDAIDAEPARVAPVRHLRPARTAIVAGLVAMAAAVALVFYLPRGGHAPVGSAESPVQPVLAHGAVIDVVDFGARPGTIFYVPSEDESTTAVVWLTEDDTSPSSGETL